MSEQPQGTGWWLASDGRYYPPLADEGVVVTVPVPPAPPYEPAGRPLARAPVWKRGWFWLLVATGVVLCLAVIAWLALASSIANVNLTPFKTVDYSSQPDGPTNLVGHVSAQVKDGALVLTHMQAGPMYLTIDELGATDNLGFVARTGWAKNSAGTDFQTAIGVLVLNEDIEGYGATCEADGTGQVWSVGVRESLLIGTVRDSGCAQSNDLRIEVTRSMSGDLVGVTFPNGEKAAFLPGASKAPFSRVGVMSLAVDGSASPPPVLVASYSVLLPE